MIGEDAAESIKIFTRKGCERIIRYAFDFARREGRKKVTAVHKANIMKCTDGMFLNIAREVAKDYTDIEFEDMIVDAMCMNLVQTPENYDVLLLPNLYGDIVSDLCAGLVGGLGVAPGVNMGKDIAIFEAVHGSAPTIAGKNLANPTAMMLSGVQMLRYLGETEAADKIEKAISKVLEEGISVTHDLGGELGTSEYTDKIIETLSQI
jgi:isocitrate dehydrogenase (NAD+)